MSICSAVLIQYQRVTDGQTDRRTDVQPIAMTCFSIAADARKKRSFTHEDCWKPVTRHRYIAIFQKWLKIDGYMLHGIWLALNSLLIHVKFNAIVPGAYPGDAKMCKNVLKWRIFKFTGWISGKRLKIDGYMLRCFDKHWILFPSM